MAGKSRNWTDVQLIISSISVAVTLGFWGLLASREKAIASVSDQTSLLAPTDASASSPTSLLPGQTIFLAGANVSTPAAVAAQTQPTRRGAGRGGGKGGGGGGKTHSS